MKTETTTTDLTPELIRTLGRPKLRYHLQLARPSSKFMSEWNSAWSVIDLTSKDADGNPNQIAMCSNSGHAQLIVDALNYGVRVIASTDKSE